MSLTGAAFLVIQVNRVEWLKSLIGSNKKSNLPFKIIGKAWISLATLIENNSHLLVIILWEIQWNKNK